MRPGFKFPVLRVSAAAAVLLVLMSVLAASCATPPAPVEVRPLDEIWVGQIQEKVDAGRLSEAYQDVSLLERSPVTGVSGERVLELRSEIVERLHGEFRDKVSALEYAEALRLYRSLAGIGEVEELGEWSEASLLARLAQEMSEADNEPLALLYALRARAAGAEQDPGLLGLLLELAADLGNPSVFAEVRSAMLERELEIPPELEDRTPTAPRVEEMVRGTVTIWVNRGIRLEGGVGYPDRVIGSGFFVDPRGYLLTNYHVVASEVDPKYEGYSRLFVRLSERSEERVPARVVGYDRIFDLALVKAEVEPPFVFSSADSPEVTVGSSIIAIGSPAGLENTVTSGIVSATGRRFLQMGDTFQVDVPINYGNSGGPLLDAEGRLVGVVFAGIEQFEGINFAIPYDWVLKALPQLYREGEASHPWLGMALHESGGGLEVVYTVPGEPAARAGIAAGDRILSFNGRSFDKIGDLQAELLNLDHPTLVNLSWQRGEETIAGVLATGERPFSPIEVSLERDRRENVIYPLFGMQIEEVGRMLWRKNYVVRNVLPGSIADETGLSRDDPLSIQGWKLDEENRFAVMQIYVKKKKSGFLESAVQMAAYLETENFI
ncbi:MAG: trypsin-like peptidase domain-containing protein [Spirochaetales bacterium]|nr:trypsin-like peptidase domain-containing protein [Spirochaetales bacterium]